MNALRQMVRQLRLDEDQRDRVNQILKDSQERNKELWKTIAPQMRQELTRVIEEIRQTLTPPQKRHFAELLRDNRQRAQGQMLPVGPPSTNSAPAPPALQRAE